MNLKTSSQIPRIHGAMVRDGTPRNFLFRSSVMLMACILFFGIGSGSLLAADEVAKVKGTEKSTEEPSKGSEKFDEIGNMLTSVTGIFIDGDKAQFMQRHGMVKDFPGGLEDFFM